MIELFTKADCAPCNAIKARMKAKNIPVLERSIEDAETLQAAKALGIRAVPTLRAVDFDGTEVFRKTGNEILAWVEAAV